MERVMKNMAIVLLAVSLLLAVVLTGPAAESMNVKAGPTAIVSTVGADEEVNLEDIEDLGEFRVLLISGVTAKRLMLQYKSSVIVDFDNKFILLLKIEA